MIVRRTWERDRRVRHGFGSILYRDIYTGWFLLGFIPLFIARERHRVH